MRVLIIAAALALAGCGTGVGEGGDAANEGAAAANEASANATADAGAANMATAATGAPAALGPCPFRDTSGWNGSIEGGRLQVGGQVDLMMAGMRPNLAERAGGGDTLALDLTLVPEAQALSNRASYERTGARGYRRGEIWCGGERIADFDIIQID